MYANRLKLLILSLLVALAVYFTPAYHYAKQSTCNTLTLFTTQLFNPPYLNYPNARVTTLEGIDQLSRLDSQIFVMDEAAGIVSPMGDAPNSEVLRKYSRLSELSKADRKGSFSLMTAGDKSSIWRVHFRLNLAHHPEWTERQRAIVLEAIDIVTPALFKAPKDGSWIRLVDEPVRAFTKRALLVFSKEEGAALFSDLGFSQQSKSNHAQPSTSNNCSCSQESDWCSSPYHCVKAQCTALTWGCGTFGVYPCNGQCK